MDDPIADETTQPLNLLAELISREELGQQLGLKPDTLARWELRHEGPPVTRIGRRVFYRRAAVEDWIRAQEIVRPAPTPRRRR